MDPHTPPPARPVFGQTPPPATPSAPAPAHRDAIVLSDEMFDAVVAGVPANVPLLVECWAEWCATCKLLLPTIELLARELKGRAIVATFNVDENPVNAMKLGLRSMPTILVYRGGQLQTQLFGMQTKGKLLSAMGLTV